METSVIVPEEVRKFFPCRNCGYETGHVDVMLPRLRLEANVGMRAKSSKLPGKKTPALEARAEPAPRKSTGSSVFHERVINRLDDRYFERVTDKRTGEVIREVNERLSNHTGHGSAKANSSALPLT